MRATYNRKWSKLFPIGNKVFPKVKADYHKEQADVFPGSNSQMEIVRKEPHLLLQLLTVNIQVIQFHGRYFQKNIEIKFELSDNPGKHNQPHRSHWLE